MGSASVTHKIAINSVSAAVRLSACSKPFAASTPHSNALTTALNTITLFLTFIALPHLTGLLVGMLCRC